LVWRALTCRNGYRREESPTRRKQEYKSRAIAKELKVNPFE
jgi:3'-phosphoadenosine 5'-phosphosulfate sulfotransferase (PAPS reductase)/FAD synthetase